MIARPSTNGDAATGELAKVLCRSVALQFDSDLGLMQMLALLNELGPWKWTERDSDRWGEYISSGVLRQPQRGIAKILIDRGNQASDAHFVIQVVLESDQPDANAVFDDIERTILDRILPALKATDVIATETLE